MTQPRPSDLWNGRERLNLGSGSAVDRIRHIIDSANIEYLGHRALSIRKSLEADLDDAVNCCIDCSVFSFGVQYVVFEVAFSDIVYWVAKVQHVARKKSDDIYMLSEIATMKLVQERTTIPVPHVFGYQTDSSDDFEFPFILMEFLPGRVVRRWAASVSEEFLPKVARQLADVLFQLETKLSFDRLGILWRGTDCEGPLEIMSLPTKKNGYDPDHLLSKPNARNVLFDGEYNLKGVIDWRHAQTVPLECLGYSPEFVAAPLIPYELKKTIAKFADLARTSLKDLEREETPLKGILDIDTQWEYISGCSLGGESGAVSGSKASADARDLPRARKTRLADIFGTTKALIAYLCTHSSPRVALDFGKRVHEAVAGEHVP